MTRIVYINASPRTDDVTASGSFLHMLEKHFAGYDIDKSCIHVRKSIISHQLDGDFDIMSKANAMVIAFPLYFFCLPGLLTRFIQDYYDYCQKNKIQVYGQKIYAIVNCGFPEADINEEAVKVIQSFSQHVGAEFRFAIMVGSGGMIIGAKDAPFMRKTLAVLEQAMKLLAQDAVSDKVNSVENIQIMAKFPRWLYYFMANKGFEHTANKNGVSKKAILRKRYQPH